MNEPPACTLLPGVPYPLGSTLLGDGVNFALFSAHADAVELCLFSADGQTELTRLKLQEQTNHIWHGFVPKLPAGTLYGYRVYGPYDPQRGLRFNPNKLLLDPYAKQLFGDFIWHDSHYGYTLAEPAQDLTFDNRDNAHWMMKCQVVPTAPPPTALAAPIAWGDTLLYEAHVKGLTYKHPLVPEALRGTYAAIAHPAMIAHYQRLGVTSIELLPVQGFLQDHFLVKRNLTNYWGYNSLNFFAPHRAYASCDDVLAEFRNMVSGLHAAGLEVILDVVYNHTAEGNQLGPTLSFRGIDNVAYYGLQYQDARFYINDTGCGNTLNIRHPRVLQLVMDSLRYWANDLGVDGFRFDLACVLGREVNGFDTGSGFFDAVIQDPILNGKKMIAEPWDIGPGGYQLGAFPAGWNEWNDRYRDTVRRFWRGDGGQLPDFARRIHGSSDLFEYAGRKPSSSINFVTSHDGFTLLDLLSYNQRHNLTNKECNNDGHHANFSHNHGEEGPSQKPAVRAIRQRQQRNLLATLLLSQGTPMLLAGDELGHSQQGNNNAYCQDNPITWLDWPTADTALVEFVARAVAIRKQFPLFRCGFYVHKPDELGSKQGYDIHWLDAQARPMRDADWQQYSRHHLMWMLESVTQAAGVQALLMVFNAGFEVESFRLPLGWHWKCLLDTRTAKGEPKLVEPLKGQAFLVHEKSVLVFYGEPVS